MTEQAAAEPLGFFPLDEIRIVVAYFSDDASVDWQDAARAAIDVIRYGLDLLDAQPQALQSGPISEEQAIGYLKGLCDQPGGTQPQLAAAGGMWAALLPVLAQLLAQWLAKRAGAGA